MHRDSTRDYICKRLAPLASLAARRRFIVHGRPDRYYVPEELLEGALDVYRFASSTNRAIELCAESLAAMQKLSELAQRVDLDGPPPSKVELVERDPAWGAIRQQTCVCLELLGFNLAEWERAEQLID
jgi:hypothetical protein